MVSTCFIIILCAAYIPELHLEGVRGYFSHPPPHPLLKSCPLVILQQIINLQLSMHKIEQSKV